jgi:hypothetical protein
MIARWTNLVFAFACLFTASGGFFHSASLGLYCHQYEQHRRLIEDHQQVIRLSEADYRTCKKDGDELLVNNRWFDIREITFANGQVIMHGHFDAGESFLRTLKAAMSDHPSTGHTGGFFSFYYQSTLLTSACFFHHSTAMASRGGISAPSVFIDALFRPPLSA